MPLGVSRKIALKHQGIVPGQQNLRCPGGQNDRAAGGRVQRLEVFNLHIGQPCGQRHVNVPRDLNLLEVGVVLNQRQLGAEGLRTGHNVFNGLQFGHVKPRFCRHVQLFVAGSQAGFLVFRNRASHASFAPVVGGQRQMPVAKHAIEFLQVIERSAGRCQHVAAVIPKDVLLQFKIFSGGRHELPHAGRFGAGDGLRVEGTFDEWQ